MRFTICIENVCGRVFMQICFSTSLIGFQQSANSFPLRHSAPPCISLNLHLAKYCVSQIRHPFKVATLKAFQLELLPSLLPLIHGGFHVMFPSQRSLTAFVQAWTLAARFFHVSVQRRTIITGIRLPKMLHDFRIVIQSVIKHALCSDVKFSFIILLSFACIM